MPRANDRAIACVRAGYLAKTNTNEDSCFGRFSNEETVPQPCLKHRLPRVCFEHNLLLRTFGRVGFNACDRYRKPIFLAAFSLSMLGWVFSIAAAFAYTLNDQTVTKRRSNWCTPEHHAEVPTRCL
jgi:hypothetical protein